MTNIMIDISGEGHVPDLDLWKESAIACTIGKEPAIRSVYLIIQIE